jgi:DNA-binding NarL/FixJ family response regulator
MPSKPNLVRIVVADRQALDRAGLVGLLEATRGFQVVGQSETVEDTVQLCRTLSPDVLVLTLNLPARNRESALPAIRGRLPKLRILALSERGAENCIVLNPPSRRWLAGMPLGTCPVGIDCLQLAARQGALGTLRRSAPPEELDRAIRSLAQGHAWYDPTTAAGMLSAADGLQTRALHRRLFSDRERQVAALIAEGHANKEISSLLGIGEPTVKKHVGRVLVKLGLKDRLQAGVFLVRNPLLLDA